MEIEIATLKYRLLRANMIEVYKMLNGYYDGDICDILEFRRDTAEYQGTRGQSKKLYLKTVHMTKKERVICTEGG